MSEAKEVHFNWRSTHTVTTDGKMATNVIVILITISYYVCMHTS